MQNIDVISLQNYAKIPMFLCAFPLMWFEVSAGLQKRGVSVTKVLALQQIVYKASFEELYHKEIDGWASFLFYWCKNRSF